MAKERNKQRRPSLSQESLDMGAIFEAVATPVFLFEKQQGWRLCGANAAALITLSTTRERLIGKPVQEANFFKLIAADLIPRLEAVSRTREGERFEIASVWENGERYSWWELRGISVGTRSVVVATVWDSTTLKKMIGLHQTSELYLRTTYERSPEGICHMSSVGTITAVNPAFLTMLGYQTKEEVRESLAALATEPAKIFYHLDLLAHEQPVEDVELELRRRDGGYRTVLANAYLLPNRLGQGTHPVFYFRDITELKRAQKAQEEQTKRYFWDLSKGKVVIHDWEVVAIAFSDPEATKFSGKNDLHTARESIREQLKQAGIGEELIDDVVLASGEALANVLKHVLPRMQNAEEQPVYAVWKLSIAPSGIFFQVTDVGGEQMRQAIEARPSLVLQFGTSTKKSFGAGFGLMSSLADQILLAFSSIGTALELIFPKTREAKREPTKDELLAEAAKNFGDGDFPELN